MPSFELTPAKPASIGGGIMGYITLICDRCRLTVRVEFARSLKEGRPHCCNQKMRLVKTREDVDEAVKQSTAP